MSVSQHMTIVVIAIISMNTLYHHLWPLLLAFSHPESTSSIVAGLCPQFKH